MTDPGAAATDYGPQPVEGATGVQANAAGPPLGDRPALRRPGDPAGDRAHHGRPGAAQHRQEPPLGLQPGGPPAGQGGGDVHLAGRQRRRTVRGRVRRPGRREARSRGRSRRPSSRPPDCRSSRPSGCSSTSGRAIGLALLLAAALRRSARPGSYRPRDRPDRPVAVPVPEGAQAHCRVPGPAARTPCSSSRAASPPATRCRRPSTPWCARGSSRCPAEFNRALIETRLGVPMEDALEGIASPDAQRGLRLGGDGDPDPTRGGRQPGRGARPRSRPRSASASGCAARCRCCPPRGGCRPGSSGCCPLVFAVYLVLVRPEYIGLLVTEPLGWVMIIVGVILLDRRRALAAQGHQGGGVGDERDPAPPAGPRRGLRWPSPSRWPPWAPSPPNAPR